MDKIQGHLSLTGHTVGARKFQKWFFFCYMLMILQIIDLSKMKKADMDMYLI